MCLVMFFFPNSNSFGVFSHSKGFGAKWHVCVLGFFLKWLSPPKRFFGVFPKLFCTFVSESPAVFGGKWLWLQKRFCGPPTILYICLPNGCCFIKSSLESLRRQLRFIFISQSPGGKAAWIVDMSQPYKCSPQIRPIMSLLLGYSVTGNPTPEVFLKKTWLTNAWVQRYQGELHLLLVLRGAGGSRRIHLLPVELVAFFFGETRNSTRKGGNFQPLLGVNSTFFWLLLCKTQTLHQSNATKNCTHKSIYIYIYIYIYKSINKCIYINTMIIYIYIHTEKTCIYIYTYVYIKSPFPLRLCHLWFKIWPSTRLTPDEVLVGKAVWFITV